jgi:hypothetical protein
MGSVFAQKAILAVALLWLSTTAEAAWLIDRERFHISVHGRLSCQDCPEGISERKRHPNPADVNKTIKDFFQAEQCTSCHEDVTAEISEGSHGGQEATSWQGFENCIECRDPHYEARDDDDTGGTILNRPAKEKCSLCHEFQARLLEFSDEDQACLQCHLAVYGDDSQGGQNIADLCLHCHGSDRQNSGEQTESHPLIDPGLYATTPHMDVACLDCHPGALGFGHGCSSATPIFRVPENEGVVTSSEDRYSKVPFALDSQPSSCYAIAVDEA